MTDHQILIQRLIGFSLFTFMWVALANASTAASHLITHEERQSIQAQINKSRDFKKDRTFAGAGTSFEQLAYIKAFNTDAGDAFSFDIALSGDTLIIGAPNEASLDAGDENDNSGMNTGAVYAFVRINGQWQQQSYLKASNAEAFDSFGASVAISGDWLVVGATGEDSDATTVNGNQGNGINSSVSGAAYVFRRDGGLNGSWVQEAYLKASNSDAFDAFGIRVAISGNTIAVSSNEDSAASGIDGDQDDNSLDAAGAVYIFVRDPSAGTWNQQAYIKASNPDESDLFGARLSLSGDQLIVGTENEDSGATGINGNQNDNSQQLAGAAYIFSRSNGVWQQDAYLKASNTDGNDRFGSAVAISGNTAVVGADGEDSINGNPSNNTGSLAGAAYVFVRNNGEWQEQAYLKASPIGSVDRFGAALSLWGDYLLIQSPGEDSNAIGLNGDPINNALQNSGAAYLFQRSNGIWAQQAYIKASNPDMGDNFGVSSTISGHQFALGTFFEDSNAIGINSNEDDNSLVDSGAAYAFEPLESLFTISGALMFNDIPIGFPTSDLVLQNNGIDHFIAQSPGFIVPVTLIDGSNYDITVSQQPVGTGLACEVINGSGVINGADVTDVVVDCSLGANLSVTNISTQDLVLSGDPVNYTITVINDGPLDAIGANLVDLLPPQLTNASWTCQPPAGGSCKASGNGDINDLIDLPVGQSAVYTLNATANLLPNETIVNTASVTSGDPGETNPMDNSATSVIGSERIFNDGYEG